MLTVGFCSRKIKQEYIEHIKKTAGVKDLDIVTYENNKGRALTHVYNKIIERAKYDKIALIHDDLTFLTQNWGVRLCELLETNDIVGLAGTRNLTDSGIWWEGGPTNCFGKVYHRQEDNWDELYWAVNYPSDRVRSEIPVVTLDGLFLSLHRGKTNGFDERFDKFHLYDTSFCLNNVGKKIIVTQDIVVIHDSPGNVDTNYRIELHKLKKLYGFLLPLKIN